MTKITFMLDGREVEANDDETIWQVAQREGTTIPHLCWHPAPGYRADGNCRACMTVCPTAAIIGPRQLDARRCIAYLTIEHDGPLPLHMRPLIGNRVFGCDDCQIHCPWNRFATAATLPDFAPRHGLEAVDLVELFKWDRETFERLTAGSAIRRIGHERWLRNLAVALGNLSAEAGAPAIDAARRALAARADDPSDLVREHVLWALGRLSEVLRFPSS
jgi:epoxyqueuosine reductase